MNAFFANFDLASLSIWLFWIFFAGLVYYLQTENMREGYPLEDDDGNPTGNQGLFPVPSPKIFERPNGQSPVTVPDLKPENRTVALARTSKQEGQPLTPTGNPMADGVGPASWAPREDVPEMTAHGHPKLQPLSKVPSFHVAAGRDPRGLPVVSGDKQVAATCNDIWIDEGEQLVRYLEIDLGGDLGTRLAPMGMCVIKRDRVVIRSLYAEHFAGIPTTQRKGSVTKLEEDKISGYYCGGALYAGTRAEPAL